MRAADTVTSYRSKPSLLTEMNTADVPAAYSRFADVVGPRCWTHRVAQMKAEIQHNRGLEELLREENEIAFGLDRLGELLKRYGRLPDDVSANRLIYPAAAFAAQSLSMIEAAEPVQAERLRRRVMGAFQNPSDMRAWRLELSVATHLARQGHPPEWPEMTGEGTYDLLVPSMASNGVEVECKSISDDKGRYIPRRAAIEFRHLLIKELDHVRRTLRVGLAVVLTVRTRLPTRHADRVKLARRVCQQITIGTSADLDDGANVRISEFDLGRVSALLEDRSVESARRVIQDVTGTENKEGLLAGSEAGGALAFVVQSAGDDSLLDATYRTLSDAATRQLSGTRPALLIAGFDGLDGDQLASIAQQDNDATQKPTALGLSVSRFLASDRRDHVVGVGFFSRGALRPANAHLVDSGGTAYYFPKRESPFWHDDLGGLFDWRSLPNARSLPKPA